MQELCLGYRVCLEVCAGSLVQTKKLWPLCFKKPFKATAKTQSLVVSNLFPSSTHYLAASLALDVTGISKHVRGRLMRTNILAILGASACLWERAVKLSTEPCILHHMLGLRSRNKHPQGCVKLRFLKTKESHCIQIA